MREKSQNEAPEQGAPDRDDDAIPGSKPWLAAALRRSEERVKKIDENLLKKTVLEHYRQDIQAFTNLVTVNYPMPHWPESRMDLMPADERADAALDVAEDQLSRELLWAAERVDREMVRHRQKDDLTRFNQPAMCNVMPEEAWEAMRTHRDKVIDRLLTLLERRGKVAHLHSMNKRGENVIRLMPTPKRIERADRACG